MVLEVDFVTIPCCCYFSTFFVNFIKTECFPMNLFRFEQITHLSCVINTDATNRSATGVASKLIESHVYQSKFLVIIISYNIVNSYEEMLTDDTSITFDGCLWKLAENTRANGSNILIFSETSLFLCLIKLKFESARWTKPWKLNIIPITTVHLQSKFLCHRFLATWLGFAMYSNTISDLRSIPLYTFYAAISLHLFVA